MISCSVLWQANIIVGDICEQITPVPGRLPPVWDFVCGYDICIGLTLKGQWFYYGNDNNTLTVEATSNSK